MSEPQPVRAAIITQQEPFVVPLLLEELLSRRADRIAGVFVADDPLARGLADTARRWWSVLDPLSFLRYGLAWAWAKLLGAGPGRVARRYALQVDTVSDINAPEFLDRLRAMQVDLIMSVACPQIFRSALLELPSRGCINVHSGPLPRYRGMLPTFWVLYEEEDETAVTVHFMNERLDDGPILLQETVPIADDESQRDLMRRCKLVGGRLLAEAIELLESGDVQTRPNSHAEATYYSFPTPTQARHFREAGGRWL